MTKLSLKQVQTKYKDKYVDFIKTASYLTESGHDEYEIINSYKEIHENTTLGQDVGTPQEYTR